MALALACTLPASGCEGDDDHDDDEHRGKDDDDHGGKCHEDDATDPVVRTPAEASIDASGGMGGAAGAPSTGGNPG